MSRFERILISCTALLLMIPAAFAETGTNTQASNPRGGADFTSVTHFPDPASYGNAFTYSIAMMSGGPSGVTVDGSYSNLDVNSFADLDPFSQTVTNFYDNGMGGGSVPDGTWNCVSSAGFFSCSPSGISGLGPGDLPSGDHLFEITVVVNNPMPPSMNIFNLDLTTTFGSPLSVPTTIQSFGNGTTLQLTQGVAQNPQFPVAGDPFEYLIQVTNTGGATADDSFAIDIGSDNASNFSVVSGPFFCSPLGMGVSCSYDETVAGPFQMGESRQLVLSADSPDPIIQLGLFISTVTLVPGGMDTVAGTNPLPIPTNNAATINTTITPPPNPANQGDQLVYTITVDNFGGGAAARDVLIDFFGTDDFDSGTSSFDSLGGTNWTCGGLRSARPGRARGVGINNFCTYNLDLLPGATTTPLTVVVNSPTDPMATEYLGSIFQAAFNYGGGPGDIQDFFTTLTPVEVGATGVDLELIRESTVESVQIGDEFEFQYTVNNIGDSPASGLNVRETLPDGIVYIGSTGQEWVCEPNGQLIQCIFRRNPLIANDSTGYSIQLQAPEFEGPISSTARLSQNESDINPDNNVDNITVTVVQRPPVDLVLDKTSSVDIVQPGDSFQYQLSVVNSGANPAANVRIEDMLPAGVGYVGFTGSDFTCSQDSGLVTCSLSSDMLPGDNQIVTLNVTAPLDPGVIINTATAFSLEADSQAADNTSSAETLVAGNGADLSLSLMASAPSAAVNQDLNYTITVQNLGPEDASDVMVIDSLPSGFGLDTIDAPDWMCSAAGSMVSCDLTQALGAGENSVIVLNGVVLASSGTLDNSASVSASTTDPDSGNNLAMTSTSIASGGNLADLEITKIDSTDPVQPGESFDYLITVRNLGLGAATQVQVIDQLPAGLTVTNVASPTDVSCVVAGSTLTCDFDNRLQNGDDKLITVSVTAPDDEQVLSNTVNVISLSLDSDLSNNLDIEETTVSRTPSQQQLRDALGDTLGGLNDPLINDNIEPISSLCSSPPPGLVPFCSALFGALNDGQAGDAAGAIRSIVGLQTKSQNTSLVEASAVQFRNIDARMSQNRGGAGGFSVSGLNIRYGNENLPVSFMQTADDEDTEISSAGLVKPWGFFANGTISMGEQDNETNLVGYDFDTYGITAGVDYRFSSKFIVGTALGYADYESDFVDGSTLETEGLTLHLYSSYYPTDRLYVDGRLSLGSQDFNQLRPISFSLGDFSVNDLAIGETEADQLAFAVSSGYNFNRNGWNITPSISLSYLDAEIDGFTETGTDFALIYDKQSVESLIFGASLNVSKAISLSQGILTPTFDVSYHHESSNDDNDINSQIFGSSASSAFFVDADSPDRNYGSAGLGVVYITSNGKQLYFNYREVLGISGFSRSTFNAGFRMEF